MLKTNIETKNRLPIVVNVVTSLCLMSLISLSPRRFVNVVQLHIVNTRTYKHAYKYILPTIRTNIVVLIIVVINRRNCLLAISSVVASKIE